MDESILNFGFWMAFAAAVLAAFPLVLRRTPQPNVRPADVPNPTPQFGAAEICAVNPNPVVLLNEQGNIIWQNRSAQDFDITSWPKTADDADASKDQLRAPLVAKDGGQRWFHFSHVPVGAHQAAFAVPATGEIRAEESRREFVQTLSKTFAQLSTGLAIFDRSRRLVLFNPALLDMTKTSFDVLSQRPSLASFLDTLRLNGVIPEPRNYAEWREKVSQLEAEAVAGSYSECWSLPSGETFKLTGRPHPDGAIALLIEDISSQVGASRDFHKQLLRYRDVVDAIETPFVVFSSQGKTVLDNQAYRQLWNLPTDQDSAEDSVHTTTRIWADVAQPSPIWGEIRDFVDQKDHRAIWDAKVPGPHGTDIHLRVVPLAQCRTMVEFTDLALTQNLALSTAAE